MTLALPDDFNDAVRGMSVTYWTDAKHKFLIQWSRNQPLSCFARIDGVQQRIAAAFDPAELFDKLITCLVGNKLPQSAHTEWPSLDIGMAFETVKVYANVPATDEGMKSPATRELAAYLKRIIAAVPGSTSE
jgi:hypothetical protein